MVQQGIKSAIKAQLAVKELTRKYRTIKQHFLTIWYPNFKIASNNFMYTFYIFLNPFCA